MSQLRHLPEPPDPPKPQITRDREALPETSKLRSISSTHEFETLLYEVARQALLTTRASGAAIALRQGADMVCRASTGEHALELGLRLDTASGLSGACLQTQRVQICGDTESDPRVDVEVCRTLGLRSILVAPLLARGELVGVMELFSPLVRAFGERDIHTLEACGRRIVDAMDNPADLRQPASPEKEPSEIVRSTESSNLHSSSQLDPLPSLMSQTAVHPASHRRHDFVMTALTGLVIGLAILLGSLLGVRMSRPRRYKPVQVESTPAPASPTAGPALSGEVASPAASPKESARLPHGGIVDPARKVERDGDNAGGLVVYQNDRVVFQIPPANATHTAVTGFASKSSDSGTTRNEASQPGPAELAPEVAGKLLVSRVAPQYPPEAIAAQIEGTVGVRLLVDRTGVVTRARVFSGPPELAQAAVDAVKQWSFHPYSANGVATDFETTATIDFKLP